MPLLDWRVEPGDARVDGIVHEGILASAPRLASVVGFGHIVLDVDPAVDPRAIGSDVGGADFCARSLQRPAQLAADPASRSNAISPIARPDMQGRATALAKLQVVAA